jgi:PPM family protein phosphatase
MKLQINVRLKTLIGKGKEIILHFIKGFSPTGVESSVLAVATKPAKPQNEDFCDRYNGEIFSAIAIADGVGSTIDAHIAAELAVENFLKKVKSFDDREQKKVEPKNIVKFWESTAEKIKAYYKENKERYQDKSTILQTTLITLIELKDRYLISYLGNGSIWYIRGDFWHFGNRHWPWCMSDLMIGHTFLNEDGKDALYGVLGHKGDTSNVRILDITKDMDRGEIFVLTTDGISSPDHLKIGYDPNNKLWVEVNPHIESLVNTYLVEFFKGISKEDCDQSQILKKILEKFLSERSFDDDATIGIVVSGKAIKYYKDYLAKNTPG